VRILQEIKERMALRALTREAGPRKGKARMLHLDEAKTLGIIFCYGPDGKENVTRLASLPPLKGRKVKFLGYKPYKPPKDELRDDQSFSMDETDRRLHPKAGAVEAFLEHNYDILFDLSTEEHIPLLWVLSGAKAGLKLSLHSGKREALSDMMIRMEGATDPGIVFSQMLHYLEQINPKA